VIHPDGCDCPLYGCELRRKGIQFGAIPPARANKVFRKPVNCSWEAGVAGETRADGSRMPYLDATGRKIRVKEYGENRSKLSEIRRRQVQGPAPQE
jgi:hypothetical protein